MRLVSRAGTADKTREQGRFCRGDLLAGQTLWTRLISRAKREIEKVSPLTLAFNRRSRLDFSRERNSERIAVANFKQQDGTVETGFL